jgi:FlaA1/EpsC-like NDP-sugar epimerase
MPKLGYRSLPLSVIVIEFGVFVLLGLSVRMLRRLTFSVSNVTLKEYLRILLIGTDNSLADASQRLRLCHDVLVIGLLVSGDSLSGLQIGGFRVLGDISALPMVLSASAIDMVLITDTALDCVADIVETSAKFGVEVRLLPEAADVIRGDVRFATLPKPEIALGRSIETIPPHPLVIEAFRNRVVVVTGAGGSIGSELSRQVVQLPISELILLDQDENSIFEIRNQLENLSMGPRLFSVVGDICDHVLLQRLFTKFHPNIILHAAAYKHVPVMEENCCEAVRNNVIGTIEVAQAAMQFKAERFLMISTDKAVRPTSVMGASKRVAELAVQVASAADSTRYACVRFGNVLGSRGSVIPIFLRQIASGGPITITDENMTRYFMSIPDAVRLILQASALGAHGDIFMLDMGDPVKITGIAHRLIEASGLRPGIDIEIKWIGIRPGEKLHEQLWLENATVCSTDFPQVFRVLAQAPPKGFETHLAELTEAANARDESAVLTILRRMPIEFSASHEDHSTQAESARPIALAAPVALRRAAGVS